MPLFEYRGLNRAGKSVKGSVDSDSLRTAKAKLKKDGIFVVEIKDKAKPSSGSKGIRKASMFAQTVTINDLCMMMRQLATLVKANIPLVDALSAVAEQVQNPTLRDSVAEIKNMVNEGSTLHRSLGKFPQIYDNMTVSMSEAGETSGTLDVILIRLAEFYESQNDLQTRLRSALTYPAIMLLVSLGLMFFLFTYLIPKMVEVFEAMPNLTLPWYSMAVISLSQWSVAYWPFILGVMVFSWLAFWNWKRSETGSKKWDAISLKLPFFGEVTRMVAVSRFTRTLATLLTGGVPMLQAMDIVRNVVNNDVLARAIDDARGNISEGESIAGPLRKSGEFPSLLVHMVGIGEKTGDLENMLIQVAEAYDFQAKAKISGLTSAIGPFILVFMAAIILITFISIFVPMFEMSGNLG